jgi:hypothetical protein
MSFFFFFSWDLTFVYTFIQAVLCKAIIYVENACSYYFKMVCCVRCVLHLIVKVKFSCFGFVDC